MLNSTEYQEAFGLDTVPYERFVTPLMSTNVVYRHSAHL